MKGRQREPECDGRALDLRALSGEFSKADRQSRNQSWQTGLLAPRSRSALESVVGSSPRRRGLRKCGFQCTAGAPLLPQEVCTVHSSGRHRRTQRRTGPLVLGSEVGWEGWRGVTQGSGRRQQPGPQAVMLPLGSLLTRGLASGWVLAVELISFSLVELTVWWSRLEQRADCTRPLTLLSVPLPIFPSCLRYLSAEGETEAQARWASERSG